jgi:hypothetical protein
MAKRVTRAQMRRRDRSPSRPPLADLGELQTAKLGLRLVSALPHYNRCSWFIDAVLTQHTPGDPGQLVGQSRRQYVVVQACGRGREPCPETVLAPLGRPEQQYAGGLNQQGSQIAVTSLGGLASV